MMTPCKKWPLGLIVVASLTLSGIVRADYMAGVRAFNNQDYAKARVEFEKAAKEDHALALTYLAKIYNEGLGTPRDPRRAHDLYLRLADRGDRAAMIQLGDLTLEGAVVAPDRGNAASWYEKAAAKGNTEGYCRLSKLQTGRSGEEQQAAKYLSKAAEEKAFPASVCASRAREELARLYALGIGVPKNDCMAIKYRGALVAHGGGESNWLGAAIQRQDPQIQSVILAMVVAQYNRARASNPSIGKDAFVKAVLGDYSDASRNLLVAVLTKHGLGLTKDVAAADRLADEAIAKMDDESFQRKDIKEWARWFYNSDLSCLELEG